MLDSRTQSWCPPCVPTPGREVASQYARGVRRAACGVRRAACGVIPESADMDGSRRDRITLGIGAWFDPARRRLGNDRVMVHLTPLESDVLHLLTFAETDGIADSDLARDAWGHEGSSTTDPYRQVVTGLRKKLAILDERLRIVRLRRQGYVLVSPSVDDPVPDDRVRT
jgi:DNA-binding response OmpR family regulator